MPFDETGRLEALIFGLVLDAGETLRGGPVAGQFEDPAQQHRHVREFARRFDVRFAVSLDAPNRSWGSRNRSGTRAWPYFTIFLQRVGSPARTTRRRAAPDRAANRPRQRRP